MTDLFDTPRARHWDRPTSHLAGRNHAGKAATNCRVILAALKDNPDSTYRELSSELPVALDAIEVQRRLSDLKGQDYVMVTGTRVCRLAGTKCSTYRVTPAGASALREGV